MKKILMIFGIFTVLGFSTSAFAAPYRQPMGHSGMMKPQIHHQKVVKPQVHQHYHYPTPYYDRHYHTSGSVVGGVLVGALLGGIIGGIAD